MRRRPSGESSPAPAHRRDADRAAGARAKAGRPLRAAVITASDTRTPGTDTSGATIVGLLEAAGIGVAATRMVYDETTALRAALETVLELGVDLVILTGGTGIAPRDVTPEVVRAVCPRELPGFGELFRRLSFDVIGPAAYLSRALCATRGRQVVFALPGSPAACRLALERLILPEIHHLVAQLTRRA